MHRACSAGRSVASVVSVPLFTVGQSPRGPFRPSARSAVTLSAIWSFPDVQIRALKGMPVYAMRPSGVLGCIPNTTKHVDLLRDRFQVMRIHAGTIAAKVVDLQTCRDLPVMCFIGKTVGHHSLRSRRSRDTKDSISGRIDVSRPLPAGSPFSVVGYSVKEALREHRNKYSGSSA